MDTVGYVSSLKLCSPKSLVPWGHTSCGLISHTPAVIFKQWIRKLLEHIGDRGLNRVSDASIINPTHRKYHILF